MLDVEDVIRAGMILWCTIEPYKNIGSSGGALHNIQYYSIRIDPEVKRLVLQGLVKSAKLARKEKEALMSVWGSRCPFFYY